MAITFATAWPAALTNKEWQKKKTVGDKILTKTDLGAELDKAAKAWGLVKWDLMKAEGKVCPRPSDWDLAKTNGGHEWTGQAAVAKKAIEAAAKQAGIVKNTKGLSSGTKTAATNIETGLNAQAKHIADIKFTDFDTKKHELEQFTAQIHMKALQDTVARGIEFIKDTGGPSAWPKRRDVPYASALAIQVAKKFNAGAHKASRDITQALNNIGAVGNKPDPKPLGADLLEWANANTVSVEPGEVAEALGKYTAAVVAINNWLK
jgi:hypothetical protein